MTWDTGQPYEFRSPDGHLTEIYFETEKYRSTSKDESALKNTVSRFPGRGINVRRIDHLNLFASDVRAFRDFQLENLGGVLSETIVNNLEEMQPQAVWFMVNSKSYDLAVTYDALRMKGRFHHVTYAVNSREEVLIAADICLRRMAFKSRRVRINTPFSKHFFFTYTSQVVMVWKLQTPLQD